MREPHDIMRVYDGSSLSLAMSAEGLRPKSSTLNSLNPTQVLRRMGLCPYRPRRGILPWTTWLQNGVELLPRILHKKEQN